MRESSHCTNIALLVVLKIWGTAHGQVEIPVGTVSYLSESSVSLQDLIFLSKVCGRRSHRAFRLAIAPTLTLRFEFVLVVRGTQTCLAEAAVQGLNVS